MIRLLVEPPQIAQALTSTLGRWGCPPQRDRSPAGGTFGPSARSAAMRSDLSAVTSGPCARAPARGEGPSPLLDQPASRLPSAPRPTHLEPRGSLGAAGWDVARPPEGGHAHDRSPARAMGVGPWHRHRYRGARFDAAPTACRQRVAAPSRPRALGRGEVCAVPASLARAYPSWAHSLVACSRLRGVGAARSAHTRPRRRRPLAHPPADS